MKAVLCMSPHFDDGCLSAGQFLAGRPNCDVVTLFAGFPANPDIQTDYDKKTGFKDARDAIAIRRNEDNEALALLQANPIHLNFVDHQYGETNNHELMFRKLEEIYIAGDYEFVIAPLGIDHPDHIETSILARELWKERRDKGMKLYLWEDLPHRVLWPEKVFQRLEDIREQRYNLSLEFIGDGPMADKVRALWLYRSQINTGELNPWVLYVPERFWEVR